jgi:hypothetical protein
MKKLLVILILALFAAGCTKMEDKKTTSGTTNTTDKSVNPHGDMNKTTTDTTNPHGNVKEGTKDEKAEKLVKDAEDFDKVYEKSKSADNKAKYIEKHLAAGNYLMFEADLNPKEKYGPALKQYKKVLEADPTNKEALTNKEQIESIYESMGRPIPQ